MIPTGSAKDAPAQDCVAIEELLLYMLRAVAPCIRSLHALLEMLNLLCASVCVCACVRACACLCVVVVVVVVVEIVVIIASTTGAIEVVVAEVCHKDQQQSFASRQTRLSFLPPNARSSVSTG